MTLALLALILVGPGQADAALILSRQIFYNESFWDGGGTSMSAFDDAAIAIDKSALLPGQTSTFANFTSYDLGINGIMVDIAEMDGLPSLSDFSFLVGNNSDVTTWAEAPTPLGLAVRAGEGVSGSDRVTITWSNHAIENQWLQVTMKTTLGLLCEDIFYFGNLVGDATGDGQVALIDSLVIIDALYSSGVSYQTDIKDPLDINRDGQITTLDDLLVNNILNTSGPTSLVSFTAPQAITPVPEPVTILLLGFGLAGIAGLRRKCRKDAR
jgi:hypothetical protein